ncbi:ABC transporter permease [Tranquillimonas rosea]|uniref:ABC transporter permease n=1 Tax=Tranquillimonas rosea TaxID=641238 RepID=UPI003BAA4605
MTDGTHAAESEAPRADSGRDRLAEIARWIVRHPAVFPFALLVVSCIVVGSLNSDFWQLANLFDILRASVVRGIFALGVLVVLAAGGLDVSFTAIAALVMYSVTLLVHNFVPGMPMAPIFLMGAIGGAALGVVNGLLVNTLRAPALIVTIGTQYAFRGILLTFIGTSLFMNIPQAMSEFGRLSLLTRGTESGLTIQLPAYVLVFLVAALLTWALLNRTLMGRAIYAVGGNPDIAARLGYSVGRVRTFVFAFAGLLAGTAGIMHVTANRLANPFDLAGTELAVIAAVILGGARITGGSGTVLGTVLGVLVITLVDNVLILIGVPSTWQLAIVGGFIVFAGLFYARLDAIASRY